MVERPTTEPRASEPSLAEAPSAHAELQISLKPVPAIRDPAPRVVREPARRFFVSPGQTRYLITISGVLGSTFVGSGAAVLTLNISRTLTGLALAELGLALAVAALIVWFGWRERLL